MDQQKVLKTETPTTCPVLMEKPEVGEWERWEEVLCRP